MSVADKTSSIFPMSKFKILGPSNGNYEGGLQNHFGHNGSIEKLVNEWLELNPKVRIIVINIRSDAEYKLMLYADITYEEISDHLGISKSLAVQPGVQPSLWEYETFLVPEAFFQPFEREKILRTLNSCGEKGWELTSAFELPFEGYNFIFKRPRGT